MTAQFVTTPEREFEGMSGDVIAQMDVDVPGTLWDRVEESGSALRVIKGWLAEEVYHHTCGGGTVDVNFAHEPYCGIEPLRDLRFEHATVWRIVSKDPDEIEEYSGRLVSDDRFVFVLIVHGDRFPTTFPKVNHAGVTVWRKS